MRVLVLGATGVVGTHMARVFKAAGDEVLTVARNTEGVTYRADVSDEAGLARVVGDSKADVVVNAIKPAMSVDMMEEDKAAAYALDTLLPHRIAKLQKRHGFRLVHISTDGLYEGKEGESYAEESTVYPRNYYFYTKAVAEERIRCICDESKYLILRTEGVFGFDYRNTNFYARVRESSKAGKPVTGATDQFAQPISGEELARAVRSLLSKGKSGVYNAVGPDYMSRFEFAQRVVRVAGFKCEVQPVSVAARKIFMPAFLRIDISKLQRDAGKLKPVDSQISEIAAIDESK